MSVAILSSVAMLFLSMSVASMCERHLKEQAYFSETVIAKAIGRFDDPFEQQVFGSIVRAYPYARIAEHYRIPMHRVLDIANRGGGFLILEKEIETIDQ